MQRRIVYQGQVALDADFLWGQRNLKTALGQALNLLYGDFSAVSAAFGFAITQDAGGLSLTIGEGVVCASGAVDQVAFGGNGGGITADTSAGFVVYECPGATLTLTAGQTATVYAVCAETDTDATVLPFYNADTPSQTQAGPNNAGTSLPVTRVAQVMLTLASVVPEAPAGGSVVPLYTVSTPSGATNAAGTTITPLDAFYPTIPQLARGRLLNIQRFESSGTYTKTLGTRSIIVEVQGGGSSGYGCTGQAAAGTCSVGSGGNAGTYLKGLILNPIACTVTIGAQTGNGWNGAGIEGNASSFGDYITCPGGGSPSGWNQQAAPLATGGHPYRSPTYSSSVTPLEIMRDVAGGEGVALSNTVGWGANGGSSKFGAGGGNASGGASGDDGTGWGAGGSGTFSPSGGAALAGGKGAPGIVIVYEYS